MNNQPPTRTAIRAIFIAMLAGSVLIALIAMFLPSIVGFDDEMTTIMRVVLGAAAVVNVIQAFWLKAKLTRQLPPEERNTGEPNAAARKSGGTVQRQ
jgi:predicted MFS family arabinose efflux permease